MFSPNFECCRSLLREVNRLHDEKMKHFWTHNDTEAMKYHRAELAMLTVLNVVADTLEKKAIPDYSGLPF